MKYRRSNLTIINCTSVERTRSRAIVRPPDALDLIRLRVVRGSVLPRKIRRKITNADYEKKKAKRKRERETRKRQEERERGKERQRRKKLRKFFFRPSFSPRRVAPVGRVLVIVLIIVVVIVGNLINYRSYKARLKSESKVVAPHSRNINLLLRTCATHCVVAVHSNYGVRNYDLIRIRRKRVRSSFATSVRLPPGS